MQNAKPTAAVAPPPPARDLADGWLVDLRRQGAKDQRDAARETSLHERKLGSVDICICNGCAGPFHVIPSAGKH